MVDLRKEFKEILNDFGTYYLLVRSDRVTRCECVDTLYNAAKDNCPICFGTGHINIVEKIGGRDIVAAIPETISRAITQTGAGSISLPTRRFYLKHDVRPKRKDLLIVCTWENDKPVIDEYTEIYEVNHSEPKRANSGRIEYFIASCLNDPINADIKLYNMVQNEDKAYYMTVRR